MRRCAFIYAFDLLLERRFWLFLTADLLLIGIGLLTGLLGSGRLEELYFQMGALPPLLLGVPVLSSTIALERRAGSLDLALAVPSTERYFLRRVMPVSAFFIVQSWVFTLVSCIIVWGTKFFPFLASSKGFYVLPALVHATLLGLLVGAITLFWASRIASAGGVITASFATLLLLSKWIVATPIVKGLGPSISWYFGIISPVHLAVVWNLIVIALATVLFYLYARERLRRPELLIA